MSLSRNIRSLLAYVAAGFVLHLAWENAQMPLYANAGPLAQHFGMCLYATATGDMFAMALIYLALAAAHRRFFWITAPDALRHPATWTIPLIIGVLIAVFFELRGVHVTRAWQYAPAMPVLPVLHAGLAPLLQMIVIPPLTMLLARTLSR